MFTQSTVKSASSGTAWKTDSMRGYAFKTALNAETYGAGAYTLTFREAENDNGNPVDHVFYFDVNPAASATAASVTDADDLLLDKELLGHVLTSSWNVGTAADFETARVGGGGTW